MLKEINNYYDPLLGYVKKRVDNTMDAEDLTQEIFLKLSRSDLETVENLKSWMYRIAKNTIIDYYRARQKKLEDLVIDLSNESLDDENTIEELSRCILPFIEKLPEEYRTLLKLSELDNIPQKQISEQMNMNYVTVRSKIQRGRKKLRQIFEECCHISSAGRGSIICHQKPTNCCGD
ncbi:sigma-70 family RNA polymerase sigma factor [Poritiphilus flavus]|uniref:Sigma-70 family RNA polymerase sigma factor n=1 Tax=Poritiphilus flavus TaxID=2697053 RepID=A0A6L9EBU0_9FLAO|nr:sigma-70 family RNA polymerase sigma factor [Poritiphilus flavus]NAS12197.1 sigma-70 family RNA polymerase sigma factor [Poritiphilus flavus]